MKVTIIGSGNVATVFGKKILEAGHSILQVIGRNQQRAKFLADALGTTSLTDIAGISSAADIYIFAVSDMSLTDLGKKVHFENKIAVHTAGSVSKEVLSKITSNYGVIYPLQTLRKEIPSPENIPVLVDASNKPTLRAITEFASSFSGYVGPADDAVRLSFHLAATIINNFTNHLLMLTENYCLDQQIDFRHLAPLMEETVKRAFHFHPVLVQTGPAMRGDISTIQKHLEALAEYPELRKIYDIFTMSIGKFK